MGTSQERRRSKRSKGILQASLGPTPQEASQCSCSSVNITQDGMRILLSKEVAIANKVYLKFSLPFYQYGFNVLSQIIWVSSSDEFEGMFEAGLKFISISARDRDVLNEYATKFFRKLTV